MVNQLEQKLQTKLNSHRASSGISTVNLDPVTYNPRYPGFDEANYRKLESKANNLGLTGSQKEQFMDDLYQQVLPQVQNEIKNSDRRKYINDATYEVSQIQDKSAQMQAKSKLTVTDLSQKLKEKYNIDPSANDEEVFNSWIKSIPNGEKLLVNYLNNGDKELLHQGGLETKGISQESYKAMEDRINNALKGEWQGLSRNGLQYVQDWRVLQGAVKLAKQKGATGESDGEILRQVVKGNPELQKKVQEIQSLQTQLNDKDKGILGLSGKKSQPEVDLPFLSIDLVRESEKPATYEQVQNLIDIKDKFGDNYVGELGNEAVVYANQPIDTLKKKGNSMLNEYENIGLGMEKIINDIMPKGVVELLQGNKMTDEEYNQYKQERANEYDNLKKKNQQQVLEYNKKINDAFAKKVEQNLDPQIKEYYDGMGITELLALGDLKGVGYKQAQAVASNRDMLPNIVVTTLNTPAGMTLMFGDSYARESQDSFEELLNKGATYEQADNISKGVGLVNAIIEVGLDRLLGGVETTASNAFKKNFLKNATEEATKKGAWDIFGDIVGKQVTSSLEEGTEEFLQNFVGNVAKKTIDEDQNLFEGGFEAFEGGFYNPMNFMSSVGEVTANKDAIQQSLGNTAYDAGVTARNIVDAGENMKNNLREFMLDSAYNAGKGARTIADWGNKIKEFMNKKKGQNVTTENVESENIGTESTAIAPQGTETTVDETVTETNNNGDKATFVEDLYSIDPTLKKKLQNNPYTAEVWQRTKDNIEKNGRPERSNDVAKALIEDVADRVQEKLMEKMDEGGEAGKLYKPLEDAGYSVDLTELKDELDAILNEFGIEVKDGKLDFSKTAIDGSEATNIKKIYNWLKSTNAPMALKEYRSRFRRTISDMVDFNPNGRDQAGRKTADTQGDKVLKKIRSKANDLAHSQITELADLDKVFNEWVEVMDEVSDGLVYKDKSKRGVIKDNITQIIKNLDEPSRRQLANRLEKIMPGIKEEVSAINQMPKVIDHYYNPSKMQVTIRDKAGGGIGSFFGPLGWLIGNKVGEWTSEKIDEKKAKAWDKVLSETSEEGKAKMKEIQTRIENNQKITQDQANFLNDISKRIDEASQGIETSSKEASKKKNSRTTKK